MENHFLERDVLIILLIFSRISFLGNSLSTKTLPEDSHQNVGYDLLCSTSGFNLSFLAAFEISLSLGEGTAYLFAIFLPCFFDFSTSI